LAVLDISVLNDAYFVSGSLLCMAVYVRFMVVKNIEKYDLEIET